MALLDVATLSGTGPHTQSHQEMLMELTVQGRPLAWGRGQGRLLTAAVGLSFWGGVDPVSGVVIDRHHPLAGERLAGRVLAIPGGRGSCTGSGVLLELILNGSAPAAIVVSEREAILTMGALVGDMVFERSLPVVQLAPELFARLGDFTHAAVTGAEIVLSDRDTDRLTSPNAPVSDSPPPGPVRLDDGDQAMLACAHGRAAQAAMRLLLRAAELDGAESLIDVSQVHIDNCIYNGPASLRFAQLLVEWGGRVRVPTTLNAISVDLRRWRALGVAEELGSPATALAEAYVAMGARPTYTCAPYLLDTAPKLGEQVGWAESNAVVFANSVLGARTMKYPDYLDVCIALTGRAPRAGCHLDEGRRATLALHVALPADVDDQFWPLAGYCCGAVCGSGIPLVLGLERSVPTFDDLRAFAAAFATVSAAPMFHIAGVTPEADGQQPEAAASIGREALLDVWRRLNSASDASVGLVSLGNPHFSLAEFERLAQGVQGRCKSPDVAMVVTSGRAVHEAAEREGHVAALTSFGVEFITDTCWCMIGDPVIPAAARNLMTNSAKYAHYAPGLVNRGVHFGSLSDCIEAACAGAVHTATPLWLQDRATTGSTARRLGLRR